MSFLSPLSLILILPLGAAIVVLYLLKFKRKEQVVSSIMLWQDAVADIQANAPFQKLKKSLLLLLQLLALLFLVIAVARPYVRARGVSENRIVVIIDSSASMQSTDVLPSRFDDAKSKAGKIVGEMGPGDTMLVMSAGSKAKVVRSFTSDKKALLSSISGLQPADTTCNMRQAMALALSLVSGNSAAPPRIVVFSDGGFGELYDLAAQKTKLNFVKIGRNCENVAITGIDSRKTLSGDQQVFIGLRNFGRRERTFDLEVYLQEQLIDVREIKLRGRESRQEILKNVTNVGGRVTARLDLKDDLTDDNTGAVYLSKPRKLSVLLVSPGNIFLENALNLDPRTRLTRSASVPAKIGDTKYDLIVFDRVQPPASLPAGGYVLIGTSAAQGPAAFGSGVSHPTIVGSSQNHPASAYVDFSGTKIAKARYLKLCPWATSVVDGEGGSLIAVGMHGGRRFVQLGFSLLDSDFPLHVGFPIFVANCLDWLVPPSATGTGETVRAGQPVYIDLPPDVERVSIKDPGGNEHQVHVTQTPLIYDGTEHAGIYTVSARGVRNEFVCNIASSAESDTTPRSALNIGGKRFSSTTKAVSTNRELYGPLVLIVLAVLTFEWYAYHRRL